MSKRTFYLSIWSLNPDRVTQFLSVVYVVSLQLVNTTINAFGISYKQEGKQKPDEYLSIMKECREKKEMVNLKVHQFLRLSFR